MRHDRHPPLAEPGGVTVAQGLADRAADQPDALAVGDGERSLTFAELDLLAATTARVLLEHLGDHPQTGFRAVPVLVERSLASVVALHGLWRAGVPVAPLDAHLPPAVLAETIGRLGPPPVVVVTSADGASAVPPGLTPVLVPSHPGDGIPPQAVTPDDPAVVVFTSGSTGRSKGVVLPWAMLDDIRDGPVLAGIDADARCAVLSPLHWRGGINRVLAPSRGAFLLVVPDPVSDPVAAFALADRWQVTHLPAVPSHLSTAAAHWPRGRRMEHVRVMRPFGEALRWEQVPALRALLVPDARIVTSYGATEASAGLVEYEIPTDVPFGEGPVPLGSPTRRGLLRLEPLADDTGSERLEVVATGVVASGYLDDPALTAARFGTDPDGTRWWRSGDLVRRDDDGVLHHAGRVDDLVKIRGRLVEPSEAEHVVRGLRGIADAAVVARADGNGRSRLVAHVVLEPDATLTSGEMHRLLARRLPPHLVPSPLVRHGSLPHTPSGKVDRAALRAAPVEPWRSVPPRAPADDLEAAIGIVSAEVLALDTVAPDDDLWELGLDSLAAVELAAALSALGWAPLAPPDLVTHTTPAALARALAAEARRTHDPARASDVVVLEPDRTASPFVAIPGAGATAFAFHWLARALDQRVTVVEAAGLHTPGPPARTIEAMAARVVEVVRERVLVDPVVLVGHSAGGLVAYAAGHALHAAGVPVGVAMLDTPFPGAPRTPAASRGGRPVPAGRLRRWLRDPGAAIRKARARGAVALRTRYPGRPSMSPSRYAAFTRIGVAAAARYRPPPGRFPLLLLQPVDSHAAATWGTAIDVRPVRGDHLSMLRPPAVDDIVASLMTFAAGIPRRADTEGAE